jgi:hypothetical protein
MPTQATGSYDYKSAGYNVFGKRRISGSDVSQEEMGDETSYRIRHLSGTSISSGISKSGDGKLIVNWNEKSVTINDGAHNRVVMGKIPDLQDGYGIKIYNDEGDLVFDVTSGDANIASTVTVGNNSIVLDGENRRILINDGTTNRIVIGEI